MPRDDRHAATPDVSEPFDAVDHLVGGFGAYARPVRQAIALLTEGNHTLDSLIIATGLPHRTADALLNALGEDLDRRGDVLAVAAERRSAYRERFGYEQLRRTAFPDPIGERLASNSSLVAELRRLVAAAPRPLRALDHVPATPETVARRALWLDSTYDLAHARLLCVGDHDLTALAACLVNPALRSTVVDLDERLLEFVDTEANRHGLSITCLYSDLRFGLPTAARGTADLAFTDPPYTPEGVRLFVARGLEGIRDRTNGRVLMAYGFGEHQPALGLKAQQAAQSLHVVYEAIIADFNRYHGAQAIGGASDLYVCRPTARTWKVLEHVIEKVNIYTHGRQALEGGRPDLAHHLASAVLNTAPGPAHLPIKAAIGERWTHNAPAGAAAVSLSQVLDGTAQTQLRAARSAAIAIDLDDDPGAWLLRVLLAVNADRLAVLAPNRHPDLVSATAQHALVELVEAKWRLRFHRSTPDSEHAVIEADAVDPNTLPPPARAARWLLDRAHGKLGNVWREGLISASRTLGSPLSKNEARGIVDGYSVYRDSFNTPVIELPRHQLRDAVGDITRSTEGLGSQVSS